MLVHQEEDTMMKKCLLFVALMVIATPCLAQTTVTYLDFADLSAFTLNGQAAEIGNPVLANGRQVLRLNLSENDRLGSAFLTQPLGNSSLSFSTAFSFQITRVPDYEPGDGLTFVLQGQGPDAIGGDGWQLGYGGITPSLAVEFDTYNNGTDDQSNSNHVAIDVNGVLGTVSQYNNLTTPMNNGAVWYAWVDYDGGARRLEVRLAETEVRPERPILAARLSLANLLGGGQLWAGFTAATGGAYELHDILSWTITYGPSGPIVPYDTASQHRMLLLGDK
jgi:hypothetical protein